MKPVLAVELEGQLVGELSLDTQTDALQLTYTETWKNQQFALSPFLPLHDTISPIAVQRFLRNLFPEGNSFERLISSYQISKNNTFGLMRILGTDTASGLVFKAPGQGLENATQFRPVADAELIKRLEEREFKGLAVWDDKPRLSVAGIQDKINVLLDESGNIGFGEGALCSTHILKFEQSQHSHLVLNEFLMMRLAKKIGLPVAEVSLRRYGSYPALLVQRFDRKRLSAQQVQRFYVIDACQALNLPPEYKYERNFGSGRDVQDIRDGASLAKLFELVRHSNTPALNTKQLLDQVLFNLCIDNHDAHGKNFSFYLDNKGLRLTPAYDLVNIAIYPHLDQEMAMALGDEFDSQIVYAYQLADFADTCSLPRRLVANRLKTITQAVSKNLGQLNLAVELTDETEWNFVLRLQQLVKKRCEHLSDQIGEIIAIRL